MDDREICGECKYHKFSEFPDFVCTNEDSEYYCDFTDYTDTCDGFEKR